MLKLPIQTGGGGAMSNDNLLEQAKAIHEKYASRDESIDEVCQAHLAADLLPELIAEVERLRSENNRINKLREAEIDQAGAAERVYLEAMMVKDARIKKLEADRIEARAQYLLFMNDNPGCIAWNFDELDETEQDALREQARYMLELEEPWAYVQLREAREQVKLLEAAFLKAEKANLMHHMDADYADENAREALERIKESGKDMPS